MTSRSDLALEVVRLALRLEALQRDKDDLGMADTLVKLVLAARALRQADEGEVESPA